MARGWFVFLGVLVAVACSGRTKDRDATTAPGAAGDESAGGEAASGGASGGRIGNGGELETGGRPVTGGAATVGGVPTFGGAAATGGSATSGECVLAYRHDRCCPEPEPVSRDELGSDPCLQEWTPLLFGPNKPSACPFPDCAVACQSVAPESRLVALDADGRCTFAPECERATDCTELWNRDACCPCGAAFPKGWQGKLECLVPEDEIPSLNCGFCVDVHCEQCSRLAQLTCVTPESGLSRCEHGKDVGELQLDECVDELPCAHDPSHACTVCVAPGQAACGGPAPPPDECEGDADCRERADNLNCEQVPCQNKRCVQGCLLDDDCDASEVCDDYHCRPGACAANSSCGPDHTCVSESCVRRPCETSADCDGYCVKGLCYDEPGRCADGCLP